MKYIKILMLISPMSLSAMEAADFFAAYFNDENYAAQIQQQCASLVGLSATYDIGKILGYGCFGTVYTAQDRSTGAQIAIKQVREHKDTIHEAIILLMLKHENILKCHGFFYTYTNMNELRLNIILAYSDISVDKLIKHKRFSEDALAEVGKQILKGLSYLHSLNLVHADLKLNNVMVKEDGVVVLIDFGTCTLVMPGSVSSIPCDFCEDRGFDQKCDICSFVALIWDAQFLNNEIDFENRGGMTMEKDLDFTYWGDNKLTAGMFIKHFFYTAVKIEPNERPSATALLEHPFFTQQNFKEADLAELVLSFDAQAQDENETNAQDLTLLTHLPEESGALKRKCDFADSNEKSYKYPKQ